MATEEDKKFIQDLFAPFDDELAPISGSEIGFMPPRTSSDLSHAMDKLDGVRDAIDDVRDAILNHTDETHRLKERIATLEAERDSYKRDYVGACELVAKMHAAAFNGVERGPIAGVVEDIANLRAAYDLALKNIGEMASALAGRTAADRDYWRREAAYRQAVIESMHAALIGNPEPAKPPRPADRQMVDDIIALRDERDALNELLDRACEDASDGDHRIPALALPTAIRILKRHAQAHLEHAHRSLEEATERKS